MKLNLNSRKLPVGSSFPVFCYLRSSARGSIGGDMETASMALTVTRGIE